MKPIPMTLKKLWFDLIFRDRIKKLEFRELKPYWLKRLFFWNENGEIDLKSNLILFKNGYCKNSPWGLVKIDKPTLHLFGYPTDGPNGEPIKGKEIIEIPIIEILETGNL